MAIASETYAFIKMTMAIRNLVKARKFDDRLVQSLRNIGFVDAIASMLVLETTLISTFGNAGDMRSIILISGIVACAFVIALGSYMIIHAVNSEKKIL